MDKQRHHNLIKRYIAFFTFCFVLLLVGVIASVPMELTVNGAKLSFTVALFLSISSLALSVGMGYLSYKYWFQEEKTRANLEKYLEKLRSYSLIVRLPIYNQTTLLWYYRLFTSVACIVFFGLFLLVSLGAF